MNRQHSPDHGGGENFSARDSASRRPPDRLADLLAGVASGDRAAMAALYDETSPVIYGLLTRMLGQGAAAEETLLEVYSCVWSRAGSYRAGAISPLAWLVRTARECVRKRGRLADASPLETQEHFALAGGGGAERSLPHAEAARACRALRGLGVKQREALQLSYFFGPARVAGAFGLSAAEVRTLLRDALGSYAGNLRSLDDG